MSGCRSDHHGTRHFSPFFQTCCKQIAQYESRKRLKSTGNIVDNHEKKSKWHRCKFFSLESSPCSARFPQPRSGGIPVPCATPRFQTREDICTYMYLSHPISYLISDPIQFTYILSIYIPILSIRTIFTKSCDKLTLTIAHDLRDDEFALRRSHGNGNSLLRRVLG